MYPLLMKIHAGIDKNDLSIEAFCNHVGISRQSFYKAKKVLELEQKKWSDLPSLVFNYRKAYDSRAGSRSLFYNLNIKERFGIGVNKFEQVMSELQLNLKPVRTKVVTTKSSTQSWNYFNLICGLEIHGINQLVVGDLTYLTIHAQRFYLFCLTDVYSARIVGWGFGTDMSTAHALCALQMWVHLRGSLELVNCIHHTDGGSQYFSILYRTQLSELKVRISRAEDCLQNGYAEQKNGFVKHHLLPLIKAKTEIEIRAELGHLLDQYNVDRKQEQLGWMSPVEFENSLKDLSDPPKKILYNFEQK